MLRAGCGRFLVFIFVLALELNVAYSSLHWSILTESLFLSLSAIMVALLLDYFRTGRLVFIASASLCVGILYGIQTGRHHACADALCSGLAKLAKAEPPEPGHCSSRYSCRSQPALSSKMSCFGWYMPIVAQLPFPI